MGIIASHVDLTSGWRGHQGRRTVSVRGAQQLAGNDGWAADWRSAEADGSHQGRNCTSENQKLAAGCTMLCTWVPKWKFRLNRAYRERRCTLDTSETGVVKAVPVSFESVTDFSGSVSGVSVPASGAKVRMWKVFSLLPGKSIGCHRNLRPYWPLARISPK